MSSVCQQAGRPETASRTDTFRPLVLRDLTITPGAGLVTGPQEPAEEQTKRKVRIELGRRNLTVGEVEELGRGSVVCLDQRQATP